MARAFDPPARGRRDVLTTNHPEDAVKRPPKQLRYLRALAQRTGQTFTYPHTTEAASAEIKRLQSQKPTPAAERHREKRAVARDMATARGDAAQVRPAETTGYGSTAAWAGEDNTPGEPTTTVRRHAGPRRELARYTTPRGERILVGQRIDGEPCLIDMPTGDRGRVHLIERGLTSHAELQAIVADYIDQSKRRGEPAIIARSGSDLAAQLGNPAA